MQRLYRAPAEPATLLIRGGRLVDPGSALDGDRLDVLVRDGVIAAIGSDLDAAGAEQLDARGLTITPGLVDPHVHLRTPGAGGQGGHRVGHAGCGRGRLHRHPGHAQHRPGGGHAPVLDSSTLHAREQAAVPTGFFAAISLGQEGRQLTDMGALAARGAAGFSDDGHPVERAGLLRRALQYSRVTGLRLSLHEEDMTLAAGGQTHEGPVSAELGLHGHPSIAERVMIARDLAIARYEGAGLHICHVSAAESVAEIRRAKEIGLR